MFNSKRVRHAVVVIALLVFLMPAGLKAQSDACNSADRVGEIPGLVAEQDAIISKYIDFANEVLKIAGDDCQPSTGSNSGKKRSSYDPSCGERLSDEEVSELKGIKTEIERVQKEYNELLVRKLKEYSDALECDRASIRKDIELLTKALEKLDEDQEHINNIFAELLGEDISEPEEEVAEEPTAEEPAPEAQAAFEGSYNGPVTLFVGGSGYEAALDNLAGYLAGSGKMVTLELGADGVPLKGTSRIRIAKPGVERLQASENWSAVQAVQDGTEGKDIYIKGVIVKGDAWDILYSKAKAKNQEAADGRKKKVLDDLAARGVKAGVDFKVTSNYKDVKTGLLLLKDVQVEEGNWVRDDKYDIAIQNTSELGAKFRYVRVIVE